jgi:hypothetical protein
LYDPAVPLSRLCTTVAWTFTAALIAGAWLTYFADLDNLSHVLGFSACSMSAVSATLNVRCFASRLARLIRTTNGLTPAEPSRILHRVD